ncbi:hypothetical protein [Kribbella sindirgiensis]|uniref:Uncharacterized protein n=1 Tax=Kribbella sindirgiensis TaxID=1124744 RepID=A0A4R0I651_9ACTN|nr:hypothetical protein [Kribbella sindirgiensis]TCC19935.1 hypothetical protein E0H50_37530 [Kribbella sindirgiensis]
MSKGYARPRLQHVDEDRFHVFADPSGELVGGIQAEAGGTWSSLVGPKTTGLWPHRQAAAEALLMQAGYEVSRS